MKIGDQVQDFNFDAYKEGKFIKGKLSAYKGHWLVLFFYPADFTHICPIEIRGFSKREPDFNDEDAVILGASTDSLHSHKTWFERDLQEVKFPVISDTSHNLSSYFNVLQKNGTAARGTFIIDPEGLVRYIVVSDDNVGRSVEETLRVLKALRNEN